MRLVRLAAISLLTSLTLVAVAAGSPSTSARTPAVLKHAPPAFLISHSYSTNWSGYSSFSGSGTFTDVKGSWTQPTATCTNKTAYSSFWVGLDGYNSNSVEQLGTDADCSHGRPVYYAWWEIYPNPSNSISGFTVTPGVTYTGEVKYNGGGSFTLSISGGGQSFSTTQTLNNPSLSSAEWIAEAPSMCAGSCRVLPLTNFGTVNFSGSSANSQAINNSAWSYDPLTMVTSGLQLKAAPSGLDPTGSAFSVTWAHN
ncbi:MAG: G1 family endopeptidase [Actinomycetota bacterium]|nr:G1 family endopeptidase [Actinomycetota bacterium]